MRCLHYGNSGQCDLNCHPVCEEWLRKNPDAGISPTYEKRDSAYRADVVGSTYFVFDGWRARGLAITTPLRSPPPTTADLAALPTKALAELPSTDLLRSWKALGVDVLIRGGFGEVWLVAQATGKHSNEMTIDHALTICQLAQSFPGATVTEMRTP